MSEQLSLLDLPPESEASTSQSIGEPNAGEWLSGKTLSGATIQGPFRCKSASGLFILGTEERPIGMILHGSAVRIAEPIPKIPSTQNTAAAAWQEAKAAFYLRLISRFQQGTLTSPEVRRHEIARVHCLRQQSLKKLHELEE